MDSILQLSSIFARFLYKFEQTVIIPSKRITCKYREMQMQSKYFPSNSKIKKQLKHLISLFIKKKKTLRRVAHYLFSYPIFCLVFWFSTFFFCLTAILHVSVMEGISSRYRKLLGHLNITLLLLKLIFNRESVIPVGLPSPMDKLVQWDQYYTTWSKITEKALKTGWHHFQC